MAGLRCLFLLLQSACLNSHASDFLAWQTLREYLFEPARQIEPADVKLGYGKVPYV
jgi:hypothetical protein